MEPLFLRGLDLPRGHTGLFLDWLLGQRDTLVIERLMIAPIVEELQYLECSGLEPTEGSMYQREDRCGPVQIKEREPWNKRSRASGVDGEGNDDEGEDVDSQEVYPKTADLPREIPPEYLEDFHDSSSVVDYQSEEDEAGKRDMDLSYVFPPWSWSDDYGYANLAAELTRPIHTPMLQQIIARIHWKNSMNIFTLKMLCLMTFPSDCFEFWQICIAIYFETEESLTYPEATDQVLTIATRGWDLRTPEIALAKRNERSSACLKLLRERTSSFRSSIGPGRVPNGDMQFLFTLLALSAVPATVFACEGDCIVGITNAFVSNYSSPIHIAMTAMAHQISDLLPGHPDTDTALGYLQPLLTAYKKQAYQGMEKAIFPSYFHGKCLDAQGNEPAGCPNPDCPIVCGTPGSLVHFYSQLRFIAYNQTFHTFQALATPGTDAYQQVEKAVMDAATSSHGASRRSFSRIYPRALSNAVNVAHNNKNSGPSSASGSGTGTGSNSGPGRDSVPSTPRTGTQDVVSDPASKILVPVFLKRAQDVKSGLRSIMAQAHPLLGEACGADGAQETNGLPNCSWEDAMKAYILSFP
ncbi:hypothetical protein NUW54_g5885 [Trametes sanguinea]|uniref:Uncharacterized protein n=1 Tax=Trametes sanguinea TaxID=158606 RepID=A0ACC1PUB7_9APHY|nr:hypothetical protein NUW54_g5885 [Trametes sanguinea]